MKNFIIFFFIIMVISFVTPNLFVRDVIAMNDFETATVDAASILDNIKDRISVIKDWRLSGDKISIKKEESNLEFNKDTIKLLLTESNQVVEMSFDDYIKGVLIGEMPVSYEIEALKAQALVARSYTLYKLKNGEQVHENSDMCDDINCCQCYKTKEYAFASWDDEKENERWLKIEEAVDATKNQCITYNGEVIAAFFHANSGGKTEDVKYIWGEEEIPYLKSVEGFEKDLDENKVTLTSGDFENKIKSKFGEYVYKSGDVKILDYTTSGRVNNLQVGDYKIKGTEFRNLFELKATNIKIEANENDVLIITLGYGHGVGMSQVGANQMALDGKKYEDIVMHYYTNVEIQNFT